MKTKIASVTALVLAFTTLQIPLQAHAWAKRGHQIVAEIAEANLSPAAKTKVSKLLALEGKLKLSSISSWADSIRGTTSPRQPMHSVRIPTTATSYNPSRDCIGNNCILVAIAGNISDLASKDSTDETKLMALKYLTHFVADLHQPLHATKDTGQRLVILDGQAKTLHAVWDKDLVECAIQPSKADWDHQANSKTASPYGGNPEQWAMESHDIARDVLFKNLHDLQGDPITLPSSYCLDNASLVRSRLEIAGIRLADLLNTTLN